MRKYTKNLGISIKKNILDSLFGNVLVYFIILGYLFNVKYYSNYNNDTHKVVEKV